MLFAPDEKPGHICFLNGPTGRIVAGSLADVIYKTDGITLESRRDRKIKKSTRFRYWTVLVPFGIWLFVRLSCHLSVVSVGLSIHHSDSRHIDDIIHTVAALQDVYRFFHAHQNRADRFRSTQMMEQFVANIS